MFEAVSSIDNAIINAEVLHTMRPRARRWFLSWGMIIAVFCVRGFLPWLIVWAVTPGLGPGRAFMATLSSDPKVVEAIEKSAPVLLVGGGVFLLFLFLHWLFLEAKEYCLPGEEFLVKHGRSFFPIAAIVIAVIVWLSLRHSWMMAVAAVSGLVVFFVTFTVKHIAEVREKSLLNSHVSDVGKLLYLEVLDASFSIDGVLGAFAFTLAVPLILIGNGLGAFVVRQLTIGNIERIKRYRYLKNGAMYSIFILGLIMVLDGFGVRAPSWVSPIVTFAIVGYFFFRSRQSR